jgi:hypothetical protein
LGTPPRNGEARGQAGFGKATTSSAGTSLLSSNDVRFNNARAQLCDALATLLELLPAENFPRSDVVDLEWVLRNTTDWPLDDVVIAFIGLILIGRETVRERAGGRKPGEPRARKSRRSAVR